MTGITAIRVDDEKNVVDNLTNRNYVGSVIVNETNFRYFEPAPRRNMSIGLQASLQF